MRYQSKILFQLSGKTLVRRTSLFVCFKMSFFQKGCNLKDTKQMTEDKTDSRMSHNCYFAFSSIRLTKEIIIQTQDRMGWDWHCFLHF